MDNIQSFLQKNSEHNLSNFNKKLIQSSHPILGVRTPKLRAFAKSIAPEAINLSSKNLTHEEILLYGFAAANCKTEAQQLQKLTTLLPVIDNWATCDCIVCSLKKLTGQTSYQFFTNLLSDNRPFYVRVGVVGLMRFFLKSTNAEEIVQNISKIQNDAFYVKMAIAWLVSELAISNFSLAKSFITSCPDKFIRNKAISKARDSFRISPPQKEELLKLRIT